MKKQEALNFIKINKGYVPYIGIFDIYNDDDEIPQELINISIKKDEYKNYIICNMEVAEHLQNLFDEFKSKNNNTVET